MNVLGGSAVLKKIMTGIRTTERNFLAIVMIAMSLLYFINVVARETSPKLATQLAWIEEATLFALAWLVFVGLGLALERHRHISMDALDRKLPPTVGRVIRKTIDFVGLVFSVFLTKVSLDLTLFILHSGQISPTLGISMSFLYASVPVGFALLALRYLLELIGMQNRKSVTATDAWG